MATPNPLRAERWEGLLGSLEELSVKTSLAAIGLPLAVLLVFSLAGRPPGHDDTETLPRALLVAAAGSFVLIPMLALTGESAAVAVASSVFYSGRRGRIRSLFLVVVGLWALATAVFFDLAVVPALTR